ncbi:hypothetical protein PGTUg99_014561 [Puccinia graminis f. sp. tritici]|uniref:Uncharacterized protein n=1 Tax=Puccinia graminis f. sp. tritici TaxID=56615 RepID=A0A5B0R6L7_PUCGR|nr:hypothetical protein PGTUg99_014561 [Puccinia graminis f. sp. tritici]
MVFLRRCFCEVFEGVSLGCVLPRNTLDGTTPVYRRRKYSASVPRSKPHLDVTLADVRSVPITYSLIPMGKPQQPRNPSPVGCHVPTVGHPRIPDSCGPTSNWAA